MSQSQSLLMHGGAGNSECESEFTDAGRGMEP